MPTFKRPDPHAYRLSAGPEPRREAPADGFAPAFRPAPQPDFSALDPQPAPAAAGRGDWRRWKMRSLDPRDDLPPPPPPLPFEPAPPPIDFEAIDAMREGARKEGYARATPGPDQGYGDGHREGYARGLELARGEAARLQELAGTFRGALTHWTRKSRRPCCRWRWTWRASWCAARSWPIRPWSCRQCANCWPPNRRCRARPACCCTPTTWPPVETHLSGELEAAGWTVRADGGIERGGCVASAASGELDATLATRWSRVVKALGRADSWEPPHG